MIARNVKNLDIPGILKVFMYGNHGRIDTSRTAAAAGGDESKLIRVKTEEGETVLAADR